MESGRGPESSLAWERHQTEHPDAWNGPLLQLVEADEKQIVAMESDYRTYIESRSAALKPDRYFLAVTGVLSIESRFIVGFRNRKGSRPAVWEFAPAGSLEGFPIEEQLCREILEELNIERTLLKVGEPVGMYLDRTEGVADVVVPVRIRSSWSEVMGNFEPGEYEEIDALSLRSLLELAQDKLAVDDLFRCTVEWIQRGVIDVNLTE